MSFFGKTVAMLLKGYESIDEKDKKEVTIPQPNPASAINTPPAQPAVQPKSEVWGYGTFKK